MRTFPRRWAVTALAATLACLLGIESALAIFAHDPVAHSHRHDPTCVACVAPTLDRPRANVVSVPASPLVVQRVTLTAAERPASPRNVLTVHARGPPATNV